MEATDRLNGIREIAEFIERSEATTMDWILHCGFPAEKSNGCWQGYADKIQKWIDEHIELEFEEKPKIKEAPATRW